MKLSTLQKRAQEVTTFFGHKMSWDCEVGDRQYARCEVCGMECYIDLSPPPNGFDMSGEALKLNCGTNQQDLTYGNEEDGGTL
jgi:hypothetical protein